MSLNHAQTEAVAHNEGPCMVLAGPGSGKTLTIAKRIEYLIMKYKVRPEEILVITFTKYAAQEMKERPDGSVVRLLMLLHSERFTESITES